MGKTSINWTDRVWNPVRGCSKVSDGCLNCYAERMATRFSGPELPYEGLIRDGHWANTARFVPEMLEAPLHWKQPCRVFVNSMSDLFHPDITNEQIAAVCGVIAACQRHTFQVLTKRPQRMVELITSEEFGWLVVEAGERLAAERGWCHAHEGEFWPLPNLHLGVSVENQAAAEERIPLLLQCPAAVRWVSCEPLRGEVDIERWLSAREYVPGVISPSVGFRVVPSLDWVVCGGESGPNARPMHPDWARSLRDQCRDAGVSFHFKQWGEWCESADGDRCVTRDGRNLPNLEPGGRNGDGAVRIARVGKSKSGNLLDGVRYEMRPGDKWQ